MVSSATPKFRKKLTTIKDFIALRTWIPIVVEKEMTKSVLNSEIDFCLILKTFSNIMHGKYFLLLGKMASKSLMTVTRGWLTKRNTVLSVRGLAIDKKVPIHYREKRPACRRDVRLLLNPEDVWKHNAWLKSFTFLLCLCLITFLFVQG